MDLKIDRLVLNIGNAHGQEHRVGPIAERAAALLGERIAKRLAEEQSAPAPRSIEAVSAQSVGMALNSVSDEQAANRVADAWLQALRLKLKV